MSRRRKFTTGEGSSRRPEGNARPGGAATPAAEPAELPPRYIQARRLAEEGRYEEVRRAYGGILRRAPKKDARLRGLIQNDLAVLDAVEGKFDEAREGWRRAIEADGELLLARLNRDLLEAGISLADGQEELGELKLVPAPGAGAGGALRVLHSPPPRPSPIEGEGDLRGAGTGNLPRSARVSDPAVRPTGGLHGPDLRNSDEPIRVAILSFLFNWPSTGGGNMHTAGLVEFLERGGYEVRHFFARYPAWGIGRVPEDGLVASEALEFEEASWNVGDIQARYRRAVDEFQPDYVAITDAWNMKPLLAEAVRGLPGIPAFPGSRVHVPAQ